MNGLPTSAGEAADTLFSLDGRLGRAPFLVAAIALILVAAVLRIAAHLAPAVGIVFVALGWALIYPQACVYAKRFRDVGLNPWFAAFALALVLFVVLVFRSALLADALQEIATETTAPSETWRPLSGAALGKIFLPMQIVETAAALVVALVVAALPRGWRTRAV